MGIGKFIKDVFTFDHGLSEFELLETEYGEPSSLISDTGRVETPPHSIKPKSASVFGTVQENIDYIKRRFRGDINRDIVVREFMLGGSVSAVAVMVNGMASSQLISDFILRDGMAYALPENPPDNLADYAIKHIFTVTEATLRTDFREIESNIIEGQTVVFIDGDTNAIVFDTRDYPQRAVDTPQNEKTIMGPNDSFNESIRTNISLIRRKVATEDLVCEMRRYGDDNKTTIGIMYREGVANPALVHEVKKRISNAKNPTILTTGILEQFIEGSAVSPIPQILLTERPDRCASFLVEGNVILLCDGTPTAAILPVTLFSLMASPEDTYIRQPLGTVIRLLRYIGAVISIFLPGIFLSTIMYHQGFLSTEVINTFVASRKMVYISVGSEIIILLLVFQLVREAGLRVPGSTGQAIGIIGGVLMGQAAVSANLVSTVVLILVALTGLGNFCIPDHSTQVSATYIRLAFIIAGWMGGFLGIISVFCVITGHICSLKSFGVPMLSPYSPKSYAKRQVIIRGKIGETNANTDYMNEVNRK